MQTTSKATRSGWSSVVPALPFAILGAVAFATGLVLLGVMMLIIVAATALEAVDELVWQGSWRWAHAVQRLLYLAAILVGCWFVIDIVTR